jgi:putative ABC transport system permease protein
MIEPLHDQCGGIVHVLEGDKPTRQIATSCDEIATDYFKTTGIRLLHGREFTPAELVSTSRVAIIDERLAREAFGSPANALGGTIRIGGPNTDHQVVGVAGTVTPLDLNGFRFGKIYTPIRGLRNNEAKLLISYTGSPADIEKSIRAAVATLDPGVTPRTKRIEESMANALLPARMATAAATTLGGLALILACTGVYGLVSFAINRRRKEVGIRMALGASRATVLGLVMWQGLKPVLIGSIVGLALAAVASQAIRAMLFGVSPLDPIAFAATALLLASVAGLAALVPARAATSVDPSATLRHD